MGPRFYPDPKYIHMQKVYTRVGECTLLKLNYPFKRSANETSQWWKDDLGIDRIWTLTQSPDGFLVIESLVGEKTRSVYIYCIILLWIGPSDDISLVTRNPTHHPSGGWGVVFLAYPPHRYPYPWGKKRFSRRVSSVGFTYPCMLSPAEHQKTIICLVDLKGRVLVWNLDSYWIHVFFVNA